MRRVLIRTDLALISLVRAKRLEPIIGLKQASAKAVARLSNLKNDN